MKSLHFAIAVLSFALLSCSTPAEKAAEALAWRIVPDYAKRIEFKEVAEGEDFYEISTKDGGIIIKGNSANSLAAGLGRYLDEAGIDVSWYASAQVECPEEMPLPERIITSKALVPQRFFLNYCTFGYTMAWWQWEEWERLIDWMALHGINLPLAITGQEAVWQSVWKKYGLTDDEIRSYFTGPAHLPWHRMCNIDGVDGPLPQGWIDSQAKLQKQIVRRERQLGMKPVLPAFGGHVPARIKELYPDAKITDVSLWGGFPEENRCHFLSPEDPLYKQIQKDFISKQTKLFGTDHIYGFDLFNEVEAPSWDPETLAGIGRNAYESVAQADSEAQWLQMGWMFYNDRRHWTPENVEAYLSAVPKGKVTILDYYTEHTPIWTVTEKFYGQPYIFCYLGNFGGNTRLAGPFRKMSERITDALENGNAGGIGCTLEGFGINRWMFEYTLSRAWDTGVSDDDYLQSLDRRHHSPDGFWKNMADSIYLRGSFSEGPLICDRPCPEKWSSWRVINSTPYKPEVLERAFHTLVEHGGNSRIYRADIAEIGCQVLGNRFLALRDRFTEECRSGSVEKATETASEMRDILSRADALASTHPEMRLDKWLSSAERFGESPEERAYYRHNALHLITTWGYSERLNDYANRLWGGLVKEYYAPRWELFFERMLSAAAEKRPFDQKAFNQECWELEQRLLEEIPCNEKSETTLLTYNVGAFGKYRDSLQDIAQFIREQGASYVALQELDSCNRRHNVFQLSLLADALGYNGHFARAFPFAGGAYGNGVVSAGPVLKSFTVPLPQFEGSEPRSIAVVETEDMVFASTHLDFKTSSKEQAAVVNEWFSTNYSGYDKPVILCGDMNSLPGSDTIRELEKCWTRLSGTEPTYSTENPHGCIDYILHLKGSKPVEVVSAGVIDTGVSDLSDHLPVKVTLEEKD